MAETPKKQAKTAHIDHFRGPTKMMAAVGRLKGNKTPFERLFYAQKTAPETVLFARKTALDLQLDLQLGIQNLKKKMPS